MWNSVTERGKVQDCQGGGREVTERKANKVWFKILQSFLLNKAFRKWLELKFQNNSVCKRNWKNNVLANILYQGKGTIIM